MSSFLNLFSKVATSAPLFFPIGANCNSVA
jgi:hypothetical protein